MHVCVDDGYVHIQTLMQKLPLKVVLCSVESFPYDINYFSLASVDDIVQRLHCSGGVRIFAS